MEEDRRAVLVADVGTLPVELGRVVELPEGVEQLVVGHLGGVVLDEHRLGVAGRVAADLLVARVVRATAGVAHGRRDHARDLPELGLDSPEASGREGRLLAVLCVGHFPTVRLVVWSSGHLSEHPGRPVVPGLAVASPPTLSDIRAQQ